MNCSFDLKEYVLGDAPRDEARQIQVHLASCAECRDEVARLQLTQASLMALRDEELPRRIAFVSDKVFEPRWYQRLWNSAPQLGFIAASLLACAILVHAFARPVTGPASPEVTTAAVDTKAIEDRVQREVSARLETAVQNAVVKAVADSEARQSKKTAELLQAADQRHELDRRATLEAVAETRLLQRQVANMYITAQNMRSGE
jgi:anti-sigma factor RsiW